MLGINSYEERQRCPWKFLFDFEYLSNHPEAKIVIWQKYQTDMIFKLQVEEEKRRNFLFEEKFSDAFKTYQRARMRTK